MACMVLSALASLCIHAAKTDNQIYSGLFGEQKFWVRGGGEIILHRGKNLILRLDLT